MFEFFFKYPLAAFQKGEVVLLGRWPAWLLILLILAAAAALAWPLYSKRRQFAAGISGLRPAGIWLMQTLLVAVVLLMLWQPALSVATLRPQQNIVAVLVDDSRSMAINDEGAARKDRAISLLNSGVLRDLEKKFQVRLYKLGNELQRIENLNQVTASAQTTQINDSLKQAVREAASLPVGAIVLLSDGADSSGGIDLPTINEIRSQRIPVHTVGFGKEKPARDVEIVDVQLPLRSLPESRLSANVTVRQWGYNGRRGRITLKEGNKVVATQDIAFKPEGSEETQSVVFNAGAQAARSLEISIEPLDGEENLRNNSVTRLVNVEGTKPRVLYIEGEPKWEFKFIRRAVEQDKTLQIDSMLRTTQNKIYYQVEKPNDFVDGFPAKVEELFGYQGLIIGGVEAGYFTPTQMELIRNFADRRGGGVLFLGGRGGLGEGGWGKSSVAEMLPVILPDRKGTFRRDPANVELTAPGRDSLLCRIEESPDRNVERWKKLPYLANYQDAGSPKPGAIVLAEMNAGGRRMPLLVTQNYGRGRVGVFATAGSWRWQMQQPLSDMSHEMFWQQLTRWLVSGTSGHVLSSTPKTVFSDDPHIPIRAEVRDRSYLPAPDARVEAHILGPEGLNQTVELQPDPRSEGHYATDWTAAKPGSYVVEIVAKRGEEEVGRDSMAFRREDGVAENFHTQQNRELLEKLSSQTGGRYYKPDQLSRLADEISYSEAGISTRETRDLWDMPAVFLVALALRSAEWLLRRRWGVV